MPSFWIVAFVLIYIFGLKLGLVPIASSRVTPIGVILPSRYISCCSRVQVHAPSSSLLFFEEMQKDYVIGARARGASEDENFIRSYFA